MSPIFIFLIILILILVPIGIFLLGYYTGKEVGISKRLSELNKNKNPGED